MGVRKGQGHDDIGHDTTVVSTANNITTVDVSNHDTQTPVIYTSVPIESGSGSADRHDVTRTSSNQVSDSSTGTSKISNNSGCKFMSDAVTIPKKKRKNHMVDDACTSSGGKQQREKKLQQQRIGGSSNQETTNSTTATAAATTIQHRTKAWEVSSMNSKKKVKTKDSKNSDLGNSKSCSTRNEEDAAPKSKMIAPKNNINDEPTSNEFVQPASMLAQPSKSNLKSKSTTITTSSSLSSSSSTSNTKNNNRQSKSNHYTSKHDVWNRIPPKDVTAICSNCGKIVGVSRFAMHLDKCMGIGNVRKSSM